MVNIRSLIQKQRSNKIIVHLLVHEAGRNWFLAKTRVVFEELINIKVKQLNLLKHFQENPKKGGIVRMF